MWIKALKVLTVNRSVFRGRVLWRFSLSKINIFPAAPDLELILFPLWYWPIMNAHTKQQQDKVFETYWQSKTYPPLPTPPPFAHLLALSCIQVHCTDTVVTFLRCWWVISLCSRLTKIRVNFTHNFTWQSSLGFHRHHADIWQISFCRCLQSHPLFILFFSAASRWSSDQNWLKIILADSLHWDLCPWVSTSSVTSLIMPLIRFIK